MTELQLYKFINDNDVEYHWHDKKCIVFINTWNIEEFNNLFDYNIFDDDGIECHMKNTYFCFEIVDICEYYGINPENIFTNKD